MLAVCGTSTSQFVQHLMSPSILTTGAASASSTRARTIRCVCFDGCVTAFLFERCMDSCKMPADGLAPIGLGRFLGAASECLQDRILNRKAEGIPFFPSADRVSMLQRIGYTLGEISADEAANLPLLADLHTTRLQVLAEYRAKAAAKRNAASTGSAEDSENENPAKRARCSSEQAKDAEPCCKQTRTSTTTSTSAGYALVRAPPAVAA